MTATHPFRPSVLGSFHLERMDREVILFYTICFILNLHFLMQMDYVLSTLLRNLRIVSAVFWRWKMKIMSLMDLIDFKLKKQKGGFRLLRSTTEHIFICVRKENCKNV